MIPIAFPTQRALRRTVTITWTTTTTVIRTVMIPIATQRAQVTANCLATVISPCARESFVAGSTGAGGHPSIHPSDRPVDAVSDDTAPCIDEETWDPGWEGGCQESQGGSFSIG